MTHELTLKVGSPNLLRDHLRRAAEMAGLGTNVWNTLSDAAEQIERQVEPVIKEPEVFGSIVRASAPAQRTAEGLLWQMAPQNGKHYWESEYGAVEVWSELTDVEVLRVGLGEIPSDSQKDAQDDAYMLGRTELRSRIHERLLQMLDVAITRERKNALEKAIQAVEELAP